MKLDTNAQGLGLDARTELWRALQTTGVVLGSYATDEGRRELRAIDTIDRGICLVDEGEAGALLVEPGLDQMDEVRAIAADYLDRAAQFRAPQVRHPWPHSARDGARS
jgi:hypothetical protein